MQKENLFETTPVTYNQSATKILHFKRPPHFNLFILHWHDRMELLRVRSGKLYINIGAESYEAKENEVIIIPPKTLHVAYSKEESVSYDVIMFDVRSFYNETDICKNYLPLIFDGRAEFKTVISNPKIISVIDLISAGEDNFFTVTAHIYEFFGLLFKYELIKIQSIVKNTFSKDVIAFFEENISEEITVPFLSKKFGYTDAHFCRKFKKETGLPPMTYLKILRLEMAYKKIKSEKISPSVLALEFGFSDANYFTRSFKAHFGFPPSKFKSI